jgi:hypothetical protein
MVENPISKYSIHIKNVISNTIHLNNYYIFCDQNGNIIIIIIILDSFFTKKCFFNVFSFPLQFYLKIFIYFFCF